MNSRRLINQLCEEDLDSRLDAALSTDVAFEIYQKALDEHPEFWNAWYDQRRADVACQLDTGEIADKIYDDIIREYGPLNDGLSSEIFDHVYAGLT
jgi:hypothetical protein